MKKFFLLSLLALSVTSCFQNNTKEYGIGLHHISSTGQEFTYKVHYWINGVAGEKVLIVNREKKYDGIKLQPYDKLCISFPELNKNYVYIQENNIPSANMLFFSLEFDKNNKLDKTITTEVNALKLVEVASCEGKY